MSDYAIFGAIFRSALDFPELRLSAVGPPRWALERATAPLVAAASVSVSEEEVEPGVRVRLHIEPTRWLLAFDDTGTFEITALGTRITWFPGDAARDDDARKDVLGRVLALALHQGGISTLHGSAVQIGNEAVAFLAPKFHGKSTTAAALVNAGARLMADDLVAVTGDAQPLLLPSVLGVNLWRDSAMRVTSSSAPVGNALPKQFVRWADDARSGDSAVPLTAIYLLAPVANASSTAVRRTRVPPVGAALALLGQSKIGALLGATQRADMLASLAMLAERVPVFRLDIPRSLDRLDELTAEVLGWHGGAAPATP